VDEGSPSGPESSSPISAPKGLSLDPHHEHLPGVTDDPVIGRIVTGRAKDLDEAEGIYLDESLPEILELLKKPIPDAELARHRLLTLLLRRGRRGWEDSLL
jgi:hypothetical protein